MINRFLNFRSRFVEFSVKIHYRPGGWKSSFEYWSQIFSNQAPFSDHQAEPIICPVCFFSFAKIKSVRYINRKETSSSFTICLVRKCWPFHNESSANFEKNCGFSAIRSTGEPRSTWWWVSRIPDFLSLQNNLHKIVSFFSTNQSFWCTIQYANLSPSSCALCVIATVFSFNKSHHTLIQKPKKILPPHQPYQPKPPSILMDP